MKIVETVEEYRKNYGDTVAGVVFNTINSWKEIPDLNNLTVLDQDAFEEIQDAASTLSRANRSGFDVTMNSKRSLVDCLNKMTKEVHDAFEEELRDEKASPLANAVKKNIFLALAMGEFVGKYTSTTKCATFSWIPSSRSVA